VSTETVWFLSAEIVLVATALAIYLGGAFSRSVRPWALVAGAGIVLAAAALWAWGGTPPRVPDPVVANHPPPTAAASGLAGIHNATENCPVIPDPLAAFGRWLALAAGAVMVLMTARPLTTGGTPEYLGSLLLAVAGLMLVAAAGNLILLFVGLELISIPTYILLSLGRRDAAGQDSAAKYFFLSVLASAIFLYGLSFLYGASGTTQLWAIRLRLSMPAGSPLGLPAGFQPLVKLGLVLVMAGLAFRITAVPFHFYAPDVYQGTIQANAALLSVLPKAAGLVALVRLVVFAMPDVAFDAWKIAVVLSALTMTLGNVVALWQGHLRRLLAYSAIAHAGYLLMGLAVGLAGPGVSGWWDGLAAMWFYLCVYAAATLGAFAALVYLGHGRQQIEAIEELAGLGRSQPAVAAALAVCLLSLTGLPPTAGFLGKLFLVGSALGVEAGTGGPHRPWLVGLAVLAVLNAAIAACYYLRIVAVMYFRTPPAMPRPAGGAGAWTATMACCLAVLVLGVCPGPLVRACSSAGQRPVSSLWREDMKMVESQWGFANCGEDRTTCLPLPPREGRGEGKPR
jgi:NADH-quinone oxidoreductase subunit N